MCPFTTGESASGVQLGASITGDVRDDFGQARIIALSSGNYVIVATRDDVNGVIDAGSVILVNGTTGTPIGDPILGAVSGDMDNAVVAESSTGAFFVLGLPSADNNGLINSGLVRLIAP